MKALDLFCGAGGASKGLTDGGFDVTGVDHDRQPNYPFKFIQADVFDLPYSFFEEFDFVWASPPCQRYSKATGCWPGRNRQYPDAIEATRHILIRSGKSYVIENVPGAPLINPIMLCGTMFPDRNLRVYRHRLFESSFPLPQPAHPPHLRVVKPPSPQWNHPIHNDGPPTEDDFLTITGNIGCITLCRRAMGIDWMSGRELSQAIPPVYAQWIAERYLCKKRKKLLSFRRTPA